MNAVFSPSGVDVGASVGAAAVERRAAPAVAHCGHEHVRAQQVPQSRPTQCARSRQDTLSQLMARRGGEDDNGAADALCYAFRVSRPGAGVGSGVQTQLAVSRSRR